MDEVKNDEVKIFDSDFFKDKDLGEQFKALGMASYLFCEAFKAKDEKLARAFIDESIKIFGQHGSSYFEIMRLVFEMYLNEEYCKNEFYYQDLFNKHIHKIFNRLTVTKVKSDRKNIPDSWCVDTENNNELIPVEVKLGDFNKKALKQLNRYLEAYNCTHGIAVGENLTVELPDNIYFISNEQLRELENVCA